MIYGSANRPAYMSMADRAANQHWGRHLTRIGLQRRRIPWLSLVIINKTRHTSRTMFSLLVLCEDLHSWKHRRSTAGSRMKIAGTSMAEDRIRFHPGSRWHLARHWSGNSRSAVSTIVRHWSRIWIHFV